MTDKKTGAMDQVALLSFIDGMIKDKKDPQITEKNIDQTKAVLLKLINEDINRRLVGLLPEEARAELDKLLDKKASDEELNNFFLAKIPNLEAEVAAVLLDFKNSYLYPLAQKPEESIQKPPDLSPAPFDKKVN